MALFRNGGLGQSPQTVLLSLAVGGVHRPLAIHEDPPKPLCWPTVSVSPSGAGCGSNTNPSEGEGRGTSLPYHKGPQQGLVQQRGSQGRAEWVGE
eukprot:CAMPEP_0174380548 /NCGR_PEP_ID=MMETSP0811_2-20130205/123450_1 /TAXON_ID=73025 ORGANISM="Eutreptiella gymnastica-like, Strain CCMP1594" /NCGR_SAMPLE_ID=MMETSP0811_2 /ASSEMBLY_ACC=CAM_ASM_000667 /LENGTH=94 /DNA_ID=CAMNT_0015533455 /DNA_START=955 /DNA_END=1237 /DNA_ORIENTATION=-